MKTLFSIVIFISIISCSDDNFRTDEDLYDKWEVSGFNTTDTCLDCSKDNNYNPTIRFLADGSLEIKLDKNSCGGEYTLTGIKNIDVKGTWCTEMCCDSEFSMKFIEKLNDVIFYEFTALDTLELHTARWGSMQLHRIN